MKRAAAVIVLAGAASAASAADVSLVNLFTADRPFSVNGGAEGAERGSTVLYSRLTETGSRFNPGLGGTLEAPGVIPNVAFDDVPIPFSRLNGQTSIAVSRVTVGLRRLANAPATDLSVYWATATTGTTAPDTELDVPFNTISTISLPANGAAPVTTLATIGDGVTPLFTVPLNTTLLTPDFGTFFIGVSLSNADTLNGWRVTSGPDANANVFWLYDNDLANPEGVFNFGTGGPPSSFMIEIEGTPVPTPGSLAMLALGAGALARRRR